MSHQIDLGFPGPAVIVGGGQGNTGKAWIHAFSGILGMACAAPTMAVGAGDPAKAGIHAFLGRSVVPWVPGCHHRPRKGRSRVPRAICHGEGTREPQQGMDPSLTCSFVAPCCPLLPQDVQGTLTKHGSIPCRVDLQLPGPPCCGGRPRGPWEGMAPNLPG